MATEAESTDVPAPPPEEQPIFTSRFGWGKIVAIISNVIIVIMILISVGLCIGFGVKFREPKYFLLLANLILSSAVTAVFLFWYYRGTMVQGLIWYIVLQCFFLFFQCITTDVFAVYAPTSGNQPNPNTPTVVPPVPSTSGGNGTANTPPTSAHQAFATVYLEPLPTPAP